MKCFITFAIAAAVAVGLSATSWSQNTGGAGVPETSAAGSAAAGASNAGAAGTTGTPSNSANAGTGGVTGSANAGTTGSTPTVNGAVPGNVGTTTVVPGTTGVNAAGQATINNNTVNSNTLPRRPFEGFGQDFLFPSQTPFFANPGVRQQLSLNDTQFNTLNTAYQDALVRYNQAVNNLSPALTPEQRALQIQQLQAQFNQSLAGISGSTLTNPQTLNRFNQINRQFMGTNAFNDPTIRRQLNLSADQLRQLRTLQNNFRQQVQRFRRGIGNNVNNLSVADTNQLNLLQQQYSASVTNLLTPVQQQTWEQMIGQPVPSNQTVFLRGQQNGATGTAGVRTPTGAPPANTTRTPTGTQPAPQNTSVPSTASGPATQGGTVR